MTDHFKNANLEYEAPFNHSLQNLLALIVAFNVLPHIMVVPVWVTLVSVFAISWKLLYLSRGFPLPRRRLLNLAASLAALGILLQYKTIVGQEPASALLVALASLKLLETNRYRDAMLVIFTSYFLLMAHLLESQSLLSTVYMGVDVLLITSLIFHAQKNDRRNSIRSFRPVMRLLAIALPVWMFLFIAFPRFTTVFWNVKTAGASAGFSDRLDPGSIEKIVDDERPAFRVRFKDGELPPPETLYWRGSILSRSDGMKWRRIESTRPDIFAQKPAGEPPEKSVDYDVWLEPGFQKWLFALDFPTSVDAGERTHLQEIHRAAGFSFEAGKDILSRIFYHASSTDLAERQILQKRERMRFLQVPTGIGADVRDLVAGFKARAAVSQAGGADDARVLSDQVLQWFHDQDFRYSQNPGRFKKTTGASQLSEFLFHKKLGFCEHYAAAFATLMRLAGVPARVVVGFQGGQENEFGHYLLVRALDAHAWTEIWIDEPGDTMRGHWSRVDPTEVVAPMRLLLGGDFNHLDPGLTRGLSEEELRARLQASASQVDQRLGLLWDALQMKWNAFLLHYDFAYQVSLLGLLGFTREVLLVMVVALLGGLFLFAAGMFWILRRKARFQDPLLAQWQSFCQTLKKVGIERLPNEGPLDFSVRAARQRPDQAGEISRIAQSYIDLRYGKIPDEENPSKSRPQLREFRQSVRRFSIKSSSRET